MQVFNDPDYLHFEFLVWTLQNHGQVQLVPHLYNEVYDIILTRYQNLYHEVETFWGNLLWLAEQLAPLLAQGQISFLNNEAVNQTLNIIFNLTRLLATLNEALNLMNQFEEAGMPDPPRRPAG